MGGGVSGAGGEKRVPITVVLHLFYDLPDYCEDGGHFIVEENTCIDNHINQLYREGETTPNMCNTCWRGNAYLGHIPFEKIEAAQVGHEALAISEDFDKATR